MMVVDTGAQPGLSTRISATGNGEYGPADYGFIAWAYPVDFAAISSSLIATAGTVNVVRLKLNAAASVTNVLLSIGNAGVTLTAGQCFAGLYQGATLVGSTADQQVAWQSNGAKTMALVGGPFTVPAGDVFVAFFYNGTTAPGISRSSSFAPITNFGLSAANSRFATADTGRTTTLPGTLGTLTALAPNFWAGIS